ncbi:hypothetical protein IEQ34_021191 [Dendrobium chrysotoxum]|uniref:Uncharacterized protein n=1 Tax=Dendrobium chrysotoxum TaxID=161865 RepID=A0AAV7G4E9_DENCH|nr:hypothetical protein IEQ34_021191 [Dendrobium chrysotoxum]
MESNLGSNLKAQTSNCRPYCFRQSRSQEEKSAIMNDNANQDGGTVSPAIKEELKAKEETYASLERKSDELGRCRMNLKKAGCVADVVANETLAGDPDLVLINGRLRSRFLDSLVSIHDYGEIRVRTSVGIGDDKTQEVGGRPL